MAAGQPNRVDCVRIAVERAGEQAKGSVMASDAFFPFPDSVETAAAAGVTAIVQPGGSMRDAESIAAANKARDRHGDDRRPPFSPLTDKLIHKPIRSDIFPNS